MIPANEPIQSFVMMDFETTGLIPTDNRDPLEKPSFPGDPNRCIRRIVSNYIRFGMFTFFRMSKNIGGCMPYIGGQGEKTPILRHDQTAKGNSDSRDPTPS